jgi:hypothetical protein
LVHVFPSEEEKQKAKDKENEYKPQPVEGKGGDADEAGSQPDEKEISKTLITPKLKLKTVTADGRSQKQVELDEARSLGYTGEMCSTCNSSRVKRNGSCTVCEDCGTTSGCS